LAQYNVPAASHLCQYYQHLPYFPHALEVLLHDVLDDEVDRAPPAEQALLPVALAFLSSFPQYLDIVVQCTRKTEVRSWRTLFAHLPPPQELFEASLQLGWLKTAGGYLLVLHTFEELTTSSEQLLRLLRRAREERDWELCKELARFLMALDETGATLREAMRVVDLPWPEAPNEAGQEGQEQGKNGFSGVGSDSDRRSGNGTSTGDNHGHDSSSSGSSSSGNNVGLGIATAPSSDRIGMGRGPGTHGPTGRDYFSL
jgi:RAB6A-GEF complex partner protein 1